MSRNGKDVGGVRARENKNNVDSNPSAINGKMTFNHVTTPE